MSDFLSYLPNGYNPNSIKKIPLDVVSLTALSLNLPEDSAAAVVARTLIHGPGECKSCKKPTKLISFNQGFREFCSTKCLNNDPTIKAKKEQASLEKYGTKFPTQHADVKDKIKSRLIDNIQDRVAEVSNLITKQGYTIKEQGETFSDEWTLVCQCGYEFSAVLPTWSRWNTEWKTICPKCSKSSSHEERMIANWIESLGFKIERRTRSVIAPLELDIYIPQLRLAIEYNGLYWHSDDKKRHYEKYAKCEEVGVRLIQIFEHEWKLKRNIIEARILSALGLTKKIGARKTQVAELTASVATEFFTQHHIQGHARGGKYYVGLVHDDKVLQVMSVGKSRFSKNAPFEILRSASIDGVTVVGGVSKLISYLLKKLAQPIITYADLSWGSGLSYEKAGAVFQSITPPGYFWWKDNQIISRYNTQKHNLHNIVEEYDSSMTEQANMRRDGWRQLWNTGNAVYLFTPG